MLMIFLYGKNTVLEIFEFYGSRILENQIARVFNVELLQDYLIVYLYDDLVSWVKPNE